MRNDVALVAHLEASVDVLEHLHLHTGAAGTLDAGQQLERVPLVLDRVVPIHPSRMLEAEDLVQRPVLVPRTGTIGR